MPVSAIHTRSRSRKEHTPGKGLHGRQTHNISRPGIGLFCLNPIALVLGGENMGLKTFAIIALLGLMVIAVLSFAQAAPPSDAPGKILDRIAELQDTITELWGNASEQQNAIDAIVRISPGECPEYHYVTGIDPDGNIICSALCPLGLHYCPGYGCTELSTNPYNCGACGVTCYGSCLEGDCIDGSCQDGSQNGPESDIDCGGLEFCPRCENGKNCTGDWDCQSGYCGAGVCLPLP